MNAVFFRESLLFRALVLGLLLAALGWLEIRFHHLVEVRFDAVSERGSFVAVGFGSQKARVWLKPGVSRSVNLGFSSVGRIGELTLEVPPKGAVTLTRLELRALHLNRYTAVPVGNIFSWQAGGGLDITPGNAAETHIPVAPSGRKWMMDFSQLTQLASDGVPWGLLAILLLVGVVFWLLVEWFCRRVSRTRQAPGSGTFVILLLSLAGAWHVSTLVSLAPFVGDAFENVAVAFNLQQHGVFSYLVVLPPLPDNFREPVVPAFFYLVMEVLRHGFGVYDLPDVVQGAMTRLLKLGNVVWTFAGLVGMGFLLARLALRPWLRFTGWLMAYAVFFYVKEWVDTGYTELQMAVILIWLALFALRYLQTQKKFDALMVGVLFALGSLIKAIFLYVTVMVFVLIWVASLASVRRWFAGGSSELVVPRRALALMALSFSVVLSPWLLRNWLHFGEVSVSTGRAGGVLYYRAMLNQMTPDEVKGFYYLWGPSTYQNLVKGTPLGPLPNDLKLGGRWPRLYIGPSSFQLSDRVARYEGKPENAVTYHQKLSAVVVRQVAVDREAGAAFPAHSADKTLAKEAMQWIAREPGAHLRSTLPFLWAGFWSFPRGLLLNPFEATRYAGYWVDGVNLVLGSSLFGLFVLAWIRRRPEWMVIATPAVIFFALYTCLTQNLPRFMAPLHPLMVVAFIILVSSLLEPKERRPG